MATGDLDVLIIRCCLLSLTCNYHVAIPQKPKNDRPTMKDYGKTQLPIRVHGQHLGYIMLGEQIYGGALGAAALAICFHLLHYQIREPCVNLLKDLYFAYVLSLLGGTQCEGL